MNDPLNLSMFRAYDIRTPADFLTDALAERLARAEAVFFRDVLATKAVLVAHDARSTGPRYLAIAIDVFLRSGLDVVYLPGVCSTPYFYYAAMQHPECAAIMCGASHNPAGDTGQKILGPGVIPIAEGIGPAGGLNKIKQLYSADVRPTRSGRGRPRAVELMNDFVRFTMDLAGVGPGDLAQSRPLMDFLHGAAGREMILALDRAGCDLYPLHFIPDGRFPLGDPNPVKQAVIQPGLRALVSSDCQWAAFLDGDGDRIDFYAGDGRYLSSSFVYAAILPEILRPFAGDTPRLFADLKSNPLAIMEMARCGVTVDVIRNGHSQIKKSLIDAPESIGAVEESAHFYQAFRMPDSARYCTENTLYVALLVARVWQDHPDRLDHMFRLQQRTVRQREWGYKFPTDDHRAAALAAVRDHFAARGLQSRTHMDNGMPLDATLMRRGLPFDIDQDTRLADDWLQICQRVSQSESGLARWEVVGARRASVAAAKRAIARCVARCGAGDEYQG